MDKIIEAAVLFRVSGFRDTPELRNRPLKWKVSDEESGAADE